MSVSMFIRQVRQPVSRLCVCTHRSFSPAPLVNSPVPQMGSSPSSPHNLEKSRTLEQRILGWKEMNPNGSYEQWMTFENDYQTMSKGGSPQPRPSLSGRGWSLDIRNQVAAAISKWTGNSAPTLSTLCMYIILLLKLSSASKHQFVVQKRVWAAALRSVFVLFLFLLVLFFALRSALSLRSKYPYRKRKLTGLSRFLFFWLDRVVVLQYMLLILIRTVLPVQNTK